VVSDENQRPVAVATADGEPRHRCARVCHIGDGTTIGESNRMAAVASAVRHQPDTDEYVLITVDEYAQNLLEEGAEYEITVSCSC
jgi:hypothetical protein